MAKGLLTQLIEALDGVEALLTATNAALATTLHADVGTTVHGDLANLHTDLGTTLPGVSHATAIPAGAAYMVGTNAAAITDGTTTAMVAAVAGKKHYITALAATNSGSSATVLSILSGSTLLYTMYLAATSGFYAVQFPTPIQCGTNEAINADSATTSNVSIFASAVGYTA